MEKFPQEATVVEQLVHAADLSAEARAGIVRDAADLVRQIRHTGKPGLMEVFLAEYGLSTDEGIALMCLAEALLRVPDAETIDALIEDKIAPSDWGKHLGHSSSTLVNASTWALMLTGRVLDDDHEPGVTGILRGAIKRLGEPVIRTAAKQAMREMGQQFVLGETMKSALTRAAKMETKGYTYSYDMLGEAARTDRDALRYLNAYSDAIDAIAKVADGNDIRTRPGISVKLSALHPRYEVAQRDRVMAELVPRISRLVASAARNNIGLNIDAEEADRLDLSLDVIEAALADPSLDGWDGFGIVVQAYGLRASAVIDRIYAMSKTFDRRVMVRLVKGAYWDTEIKRAQIDGMDGFPVFTSKAATDVSYIANAKKLLGMTDRIYPQFATHNAHSVAAILRMASTPDDYEFQRLHGMGEQLHDIVKQAEGTRCRIYAPVGAHRDLLAYLVRRLLENGANSSFVNQVVDEDVPPEEVAADPFDHLSPSVAVPTGAELYSPTRANSKGWDLTDGATLARFEAGRAPFKTATWEATSLIATGAGSSGPSEAVRNPALPDDKVGSVIAASEDVLKSALRDAATWDATPEVRADILNRAADLYEENAGELFAILAREAGKTPLDAVGEIREAVDFLRYYATMTSKAGPPIGIVSCISPWNFPLAIFTGQIAGALAAGCGVLAKPAEQTPLVAYRAVQLLHDAGLPRTALQLLIGDGPTVGAALTASPVVDGVAFTGSTDTARLIRRAMAENLAPGAPLVAETGGLNAMIVDSTALHEQAVRDVVASAFQSAGQRCSALRCLYVQEDVAEEFRTMLFGAMDELRVGDPWHHATDVGPVIDEEARQSIVDYLAKARPSKTVSAPDRGLFVAPTVIDVPGIAALEREIFGPVLHFATFDASELDKTIADINRTGYGLTFGLHTRIDGRVQEVVEKIEAGNVYVNRNQIGAVVGSQPFGGEGLSGTGPKAGGPAYVLRFSQSGDVADDDVREMPGPTGEMNRLHRLPRAPFLCLGPGAADMERQVDAVVKAGGHAVVKTDLPPASLTEMEGIAGALWWGDEASSRALALALAERDGPILPLITGQPRRFEMTMERHLCVDTTASGGNADLLADVANA